MEKLNHDSVIKAYEEAQSIKDPEAYKAKILEIATNAQSPKDAGNLEKEAAKLD